MKKQIITLLIALIMPIYLFSQINIVKIKFNEGYYSAPYHNAKLSFNAYIKNTDSIQHTNLQLNVKNLQTNQVFTSPVKAFLAANDSSSLTIDSIAVNYSTINSYKFWVKYNNNSIVYFPDTLKIGGNNTNQSFLAIDNNTYTEKYFKIPFDTGGIIGGIIANKFIFKDFSQCPYGIAVAFSSGTTVNTTIKAMLFEKHGNDFITIAESDYYIVLANDINTDSSTNPQLTILPFYNTINCLYKDSTYLAGIAYFGGNDTVLIAEDNSNFDQSDSSVWFINYNFNHWVPITNKKHTPIIKLSFIYGNCNYNGLNLTGYNVMLDGYSGSSEYIELPNYCQNITNIICKPWLSCIQSNQYLFVQSLSDNLTGSPRYDTIIVYDNLGGNTFFKVTQLANISVNETEAEYFKIYPNPANNKLKIETKSQIKLKSVSIISAIGEELIKLESEIADKKEIEIDLSNLSSGIYFIKIQCDEKSIFKKLIKK